MADGDSLATRIDGAIQVDEVGIETGRYGSYFLKTMYRTIFRASKSGLVPFAVAGGTQPLRDGEPATMRAFLEDVPPEERLFVESLCGTVHLRNYPNIGVDGLQFFIGHHPRIYRNVETALGRIAAMIDGLDELEIDPALVVCEIAEGVDSRLLNALAAQLRRHGIRVAVDDFGVSQFPLSMVRLLDPDIVKLNGGWFRRIAEVAVAARLLGSLVDALQREGRQVLIEGIETPAHLRVALDTGADFLQGDLLRPPQIAGSLFSMAPIEVDGLFATGEKVVPLFANRSRPA